MRLLRNVTADGKGKYAIINWRKNTVEFGLPNTEEEFFVIKLKDRFALPALLAYAKAVREDGDYEYAADIIALANRAGSNSLWCKWPD